MNEHAGSGCLLSVLIVLAFTVIFHETRKPDGPPLAVTPPPAPRQRPNPAPSEPLAPVVPPSPARPAPPALPPTPPSPAVPPLEAIDPPPPPAVLISTRSAPGTTTGRASLARVVPPQPPAPPPPPPVPAPPRPPLSRTATTVVEKGERLVDVAIRVYGSAVATETLWRANRDQISRLDTPVVEGWLLRTP